MTIEQRLKEKELSIYECSKRSDIPYTTLSELVRNKTRLAKASVETVYRLSRTLNCSIEDLYEESNNKFDDFELFKSNVCHELKFLGDNEFIIRHLTKDDISSFWKRGQYLEALYLLAMVDYISRINEIPIAHYYDDIRSCKMKEMIFPRDVIITNEILCDSNAKEKAIKEAIPEFLKFNIIEGDIRNVF